MKIAMTLVALKLAAKNPKNHADIRKMRADAIRFRDKAQREHDERTAELNKLIDRIGIALGEVQA